MSIEFSVNGQMRSVDDNRENDKLLDFLHDSLNLTGTKLSCGIGVCRACTVAVVREASPVAEPVLACSTPLSLLRGSAVTTVEGVAQGSFEAPRLHPIQEAFLRHFAFQCGYCTPGFVMAAKIFLDSLATSPITEAELDDAIAEAIGTHICRCTGYVRYHEALREVALASIEGRAGQRE